MSSNDSHKDIDEKLVIPVFSKSNFDKMINNYSSTVIKS